MKNSIMTIFKKEIKRFFGDKRSVFSTILLPGLMIFVLYSFMGSAMTEQFSVDDDYKASCYATNIPESLKPSFKEANFDVKDVVDEKEADKIKKQIKNKKKDIYIVFPENFEKDIAAYDSTKGKAAPEIEIFYNSSETTSDDAFGKMSALLAAYESSMSNKFDINTQDGVSYDLASDEDSMAAMFSSMLPMLLLMFLFSGALAVAPESIAGEKERGTIATLLVTPINRQDIAIGKILALSLIAVLSGFSSTLGTVLSLPKMMGGAAEGMDGNVYDVTDYALLAVIIISTVLLLVTVVSLISTFAKTIKEAQAYATPLLIVTMLVGISAMFGGDAKSGLEFYCIPLYNSVQCMVSIFKFNAVPLDIIVTVGVNLLISVIGVGCIAKMFKSERIIFSK